jgi:hypothetical protein
LSAMAPVVESSPEADVAEEERLHQKLKRQWSRASLPHQPLITIPRAPA